MAKGKTKNSELRRVMNMVKRLERDGYKITKDLSELTIGKLRNIKSGRDLVRKGYAAFTEAGYERLRREQNIKALEKSLKKYGGAYGANRAALTGEAKALSREEYESLLNKRGRERFEAIRQRGLIRGLSPVQSRDDTRVTTVGYEAGKKLYDSSGEHITRVYHGTEATRQMDMLLSIAEYGATYMGSGYKDSRDGVPLINSAGKRMKDIIISARMKRSDEDLIASIIRDYGTVQYFSTVVERLVLAIYDKEYAEWAAGSTAYDVDLRELKETLES